MNKHDAEEARKLEKLLEKVAKADTKAQKEYDNKTAKHGK